MVGYFACGAFIFFFLLIFFIKACVVTHDFLY